jgi:hypothetical protein
MTAERDSMLAEQQKAFEEAYKEHQQAIEEMNRMNPEFAGRGRPEMPAFDAGKMPVAPVPGAMAKLSPEARRAELRKHIEEQRQAMQTRRDEMRKRAQERRDEFRNEQGRSPIAGV